MENTKKNPVFREDADGKIIKIYLSEEGKEELEEIRAELPELVEEEDMQRDLEEFLDECIRVFKKRKKASASADRYDREELGVTTPVREQERCCPVYTKYTVDNYCRGYSNILKNTKQHIDRQVLYRFQQ